MTIAGREGGLSIVDFVGDNAGSTPDCSICQ